LFRERAAHPGSRPDPWGIVPHPVFWETVNIPTSTNDDPPTYYVWVIVMQELLKAAVEYGARGIHMKAGLFMHVHVYTVCSNR
jgi:hypothetical protein